MDEKTKKINYILLNNGIVIPIKPFSINSLYIDKINNKIDFKINLLNNIHYNILNYNIQKNNYIDYDINILNKIDNKEYENILYKKFVYELSSYININKNTFIKDIEYKNYDNLLKNIKIIADQLFEDVDENNDKKICFDLSKKKLCNLILNNENKNKFIKRFIFELMYNNVIKNKILNMNIPKYINNDKYIIINKSEIDKEYINKLYNKSKNIFIQYPNMFKNININKIYI